MNSIIQFIRERALFTYRVSVSSFSLKAFAFVASADAEMVLYTNIDCLNKKRKFPAEQLGLPLPKHKCSSSYALECSSSSNANPQELYPSLFKGDRSAHDASQSRSGEDSNSCSEDVDSIMSISGEIKNDLWYSKVMSSDQPSTSSVNWGSNCPEISLYSLESRSMIKSSSDKMKSSYIGGEKDLRHDFGLHSSPIYEDHLLEFESHEDYSCAEYGTEAIEPYTDKELEDLLYSNEVTPNNYVLSSGRWTVNQDAQQGAKKLTIDKEFEQYFSMLML